MHQMTSVPQNLPRTMKTQCFGSMVKAHLTPTMWYVSDFIEERDGYLAP